MGLSLGCGGSSARSKGKSDSFFDTRTEKGVRASKFIDDFKNFLQGKGNIPRSRIQVLNLKEVIQ